MVPINRFAGIRGTVLLISGLLFTSCSVFQSTREMDMSPFSQNAITMFAEAAKISAPFQWIHLKRYYDIPEIKALRTGAIPVLDGLQGIVMYSNQLVALNSAPLTAKEKNYRLVEYLERTRTRLTNRAKFDSLGFTAGQADSILTNVLNADTFLDGIDAGSPLIDAFVLAMNNRLDEIANAIPTVVEAFDTRIEADQADQIRNYLKFRSLQARYHYAIALLYEAQLGESAALDTLFMIDPSLRNYITETDSPTSKRWMNVENALNERLGRIETFMAQLEVEGRMYRAKQQELETWRTSVDAKIKMARNVLMVWAQSHHNLGKGIPVPPIIDVGGIAGGFATKVVPIP
jgi:hypothetical protein